MKIQQNNKYANNHNSMPPLKDKKWKEFNFNDLFIMQRGKFSKKPDFDPNGNIPFLGATEENNGITGFAKEENLSINKLFNGCAIVVTNNGSVGKAYFLNSNFISSSDVTTLYLKKYKLNRDLAQFLIVSIEKQGKCFEYSRKWSLKRMMNSKLLLPANSYGNPDYEYMEQYAKNKRYELISRYKIFVKKQIGGGILKYKEIPAFNEKLWKKFKAFGKDGLFNIAATKSGVDTARLVEDEEKTLPYITRSDINNGMSRFVSVDNKLFGFDEGGCITIGLDTQTVFWQEHEFVTGQNIQVITGDNIHYFLGQFLVLIFKNQMITKFNWGGNGATLGRMKSLEILLPANDRGEPDYEYMEQYTKNMLFKKYNQYLNFLKKQVSKKN